MDKRHLPLLIHLSHLFKRNLRRTRNMKSQMSGNALATKEKNLQTMYLLIMMVDQTFRNVLATKEKNLQTMYLLIVMVDQTFGSVLVIKEKNLLTMYL